MSDTAAPAPIDYQEQLTRIERMNAETRKFVEEGLKLSAEARKLTRDTMLAPWQIVATSVTATAALIGGTAAVIKLLFP